MSTSSDWEKQFTQIFNHAVEKYRKGHTKASGLFEAKEVEFLKSIGATEQEIFDFVEDHSGNPEDPSLDMILKVTAVRRDYFLNEQKGKHSSHLVSVDQLPAKDSSVEGIGWLPRIIPKAEAKLRGEMPPELMYGCGGDRNFFRTNNVDAAEFLKKVWSAKGDKAAVIEWVKTKKSS